jgi:hypothetical protein
VVVLVALAMATDLKNNLSSVFVFCLHVDSL